MKDTGMDMFNMFNDFTTKLCEGNPGTLSLIMDLLINNDAAGREMTITALMRMDAIGIRGTKLYMLWNDCCNRDSEKAVIEMLNRSTNDLTYALLGSRGVPFRD